MGSSPTTSNPLAQRHRRVLRNQENRRKRKPAENCPSCVIALFSSSMLKATVSATPALQELLHNSSIGCVGGKNRSTSQLCTTASLAQPSKGLLQAENNRRITPRARAHIDKRYLDTQMLTHKSDYLQLFSQFYRVCISYTETGRLFSLSVGMGSLGCLISGPRYHYFVRMRSFIHRSLPFSPSLLAFPDKIQYLAASAPHAVHTACDNAIILFCSFLLLLLSVFLR